MHQYKNYSLGFLLNPKHFDDIRNVVNHLRLIASRKRQQEKIERNIGMSAFIKGATFSNGEVNKYWDTSHGRS